MSGVPTASEETENITSTYDYKNDAYGRTWRIIQLFGGDVGMALRMFAMHRNVELRDELNLLGAGACDMIPHGARIEELLEYFAAEPPADEVEFLIGLARREYGRRSHDELFKGMVQEVGMPLPRPRVLAGLALDYRKGNCTHAALFLRDTGWNAVATHAEQIIKKVSK